MREKHLEHMLRKEIIRRGGLALKFTPASWRGAPDRIILLPKSRVFFIELKSHKKKPTKLQIERHETLRKLGFDVIVLDNPDALKNFFQVLDKLG